MRRYSAVRMIAIIAFCAMLSGCNQPSAPSHNDAWLSFKYGFNCGTYFNDPGDLNGQTAQLSASCPGLSDFVDTQKYYNGIGAPSTFAAWQSTYGFPPTGLNAEAIYGNVLDLEFGRDMHCSQTGQQIGCYVTNYGSPAADCLFVAHCLWPDLETAVNDAIAQSNVPPHAPFATVAMVFNGTPNSNTSPPANNITFYVYDAMGNLQNFAALDNEGAKSVPRMCMACHGGNYTAHSDTAPASVTGTSFLPFDAPSFYYSKANRTKGLDQQQESFRILNLLVKTANGGDQPPAQTPQQQAIVDFINGLYCPDLTNGGALNPCPSPVSQTNSKAVTGYFPTGWVSNQKAYSEVMRPYCRMCHIAQSQPFFSSSALAADRLLKGFVCTLRDMPHAEVPFGGGTNSNLNPFIQQNETSHFWLDGGLAVNDLKTAAGIGSCP
jgi:hypothetical protein